MNIARGSGCMVGKVSENLVTNLNFVQCCPGLVWGGVGAAPGVRVVGRSYTLTYSIPLGGVCQWVSALLV